MAQVYLVIREPNYGFSREDPRNSDFVSERHTVEHLWSLSKDKMVLESMPESIAHIISSQSIKTIHGMVKSQLNVELGPPNAVRKHHCPRCGQAWTPGFYTVRSKSRPKITKKMKKCLRKHKTEPHTLSRKQLKWISHLQNAKNSFVLTCLKCNKKVVQSGSKNMFIPAIPVSTTSTALNSSWLHNPCVKEKKLKVKKKKIVQSGTKQKMFEVKLPDSKQPFENFAFPPKVPISDNKLPGNEGPVSNLRKKKKLSLLKQVLGSAKQKPSPKGLADFLSSLKDH